MRRRSKDRQRALAEVPAIISVSDDRTAVDGAEDESLREFVRRLPCAVCLAPTIGGEPCHRGARRRFGDWTTVDGEVIGNLWPGCARHHHEQHTRGITTFVHGLDLVEVCRVVGLAYLEGHEPEALGAAARVGGYVDGLVVRAGIPEF